jgi:hypothetical protein
MEGGAVGEAVPQEEERERVRLVARGGSVSVEDGDVRLETLQTRKGARKSSRRRKSGKAPSKNEMKGAL